MDFVAITSCPAGVAHTPMAAKALEKAASALGLEAKVEQQGAMGLRNEITEEEAQSSKFLLIGSDQKIEKMDRFKGIPVVRVDINACIKSPKAVIQKVYAAVEARNKK
ncbi:MULTISPECIES: PTS fructose transporter subunit IIB [Lacticaseibacillus]|uniref:Fructose PTS transporter subunit IIB n=2 Tax=Lacticaseibacillus TaxID=2759736 RepID=A0AAN1F0G9_LACCA|nr:MULTISPECIES: fructose PTS transporter subunit IIB [Lacticaseibacillus]ARY92539.1 PTS fructose transporter subunit IIB [Lacticaseibacillus casei]KAB1969622.1 PTS fructose transporter subunit IIB [Lacticaseibacillus casei]KLI75795.1 PTS fructose transporter subunit IIB [Lacticaseibacillus casei]WLV80440.1 fructose PTS transporter subunit IIB [Lacticaseibacillus sp. NCIMB 15473]WNX24401.1 fructose PTS transporter subunit IIB [Lacticaseibacillus casei]